MTRHSTVNTFFPQSPLFTANLIASIGELHSRVGGEGGEFSPAPKQVVTTICNTLDTFQTLEHRLSPSLPPGCAVHRLSATPPPHPSLSPELPLSHLCLPGLFWHLWSAGVVSSYVSLKHYTIHSYLFQRGRRPSTAPSHPGRDHIGRDRPVSGKEQLTLQLQHWSQVPGQYLTHLARSLHSRLSEGNHTEQAQGLALDRWKSTPSLPSLV